MYFSALTGPLRYTSKVLSLKMGYLYRSDPTDTTNGKFHDEEEAAPVKLSSDAAGEKVQVSTGTRVQVEVSRILMVIGKNSENRGLICRLSI